MAKLTEKQQRFVDYVYERNKEELDVNDFNQMSESIVLNMFQIYLIAEKREDKRNAAWNITHFRDEIKEKIKLWHLIEDKEEFKRLFEEKRDSKGKTALAAQRRRHEEQGTFSLTNDEWVNILSRFDGACAYCGSKKQIQRDHIRPFTKGGDFIMGNVAPACYRCNSSKGNQLLNEWYPQQPFYSSERNQRIEEYIKAYQ